MRVGCEQTCSQTSLGAFLRPSFRVPPQSMAARLSLFVLTTSTKREKPCVHFSLTVAFAFAAVFSNVI